MKQGAFALVLFLALAGPTVTAAQNEVSLDTVEELLRMGRTEDAREGLRRWWDQTRPKASRAEVQRGLWLRGRLTADPAEADVDFQRLVVEYPGGPYSGQALLRLAQSAYAAGDSAEAAADVARVSREYPGSAVAREATSWLANAGPVPARATPPTPAPEPERPQSQAKAPPRAEPPRDTAAATRPTRRPPTPRAEAPAAGSRARFAVQLGAFSRRQGAEALLRRAVAAGFEARLVTIPGSGLLRVRVGAFTSPAEARQVLTRLKGLGFEAVVTSDVQREQAAGG